MEANDLSLHFLPEMSWSKTMEAGSRTCASRRVQASGHNRATGCREIARVNALSTKSAFPKFGEKWARPKTRSICDAGPGW